MRYVGEPVALVVAASRYIAEDAAELVTIEYAPLEAIIDPRAACAKTAPLIHPQAEDQRNLGAQILLRRHRSRRSRERIAASP